MLCFEKVVLFLDENLKAIIAFQTSNKIIIPLVAQSVFYLNSLMRLKCLMLASFSVVCHMPRAEEAEMSLLPHGHAKQQQGAD